MKKIFTLLVLGMLLMTQSAHSQGYVNYNNKWFLGLNLGGTYHSNTEVDVNGMYRGGMGFTFGKSFNYNKGNLLSFDLRVRYLLAAYRGLSTNNFMLDSSNVNVLNLGYELQSYQTAYGYYKPNFHTWVNDWSLELQLNTNLLREKTGWNLFVFGGIGTTRYSTTIDLYDNDVAFFIKPENKLDEKGVFYGDYETQVVNKRNWMPSFGAGISKQLTPNIAFEIMGRMTWTRNNDFDAMPYNFDGTPSLNDRYHYVSAGFTFRLGGHTDGNTNHHHQNNNSSNNNTTNNTTINNNGGNSGQTTPQKPIVDFTNPASSSYTTNQNTFYLKANIFYVDNVQNVKFVQDGIVNNNFSFNPNTNEFTSNVNLHDGNNVFEITGTNQYGSDYDKVIIIKKEEEKQPPVVTFINPFTNPQTVNEQVFYFKGKVLYVNSKQDIAVTFNGQNFTNFNYNTQTNIITAVLNLNIGTNVITVVGVNQDGQDTETATIIYNRPTQINPPIVNITSPPIDPYTSSTPNITVKATVKNVIDKQYVTVNFNGNNVTNFTFNPNTNALVFPISNLNNGANTVLITGVNNDGQAQDNVTIIYNQPTVKYPPTVNFTQPSVSGTTVNNSSYTVKAITTNISSKNQIIFKQNDNIINANAYTFSNSQITYPAQLNIGANVFDITVTNNDGSDHQSTVIIYRQDEEPCVTPTIGYVSPQPNTQLTNSNVTIEAQINNFVAGTSIQLFKNNVLVGSMVYDATTSIASKQVVLSEGNNNFKIKVSNSCGNNQSSFTLIYKDNTPCTPPTIGLTSPLNNATLTTNQINVDAIINNYTAGTTIQLYQNNTLVGNMTYNPATNKASKSVTLVQGNNTFKVMVSNNCGNDNKSFNVVYKQSNPIPCNEPTAIAFSPLTTSITQQNADVTLKVKTTNISSNTQIEVTNNNTIIPFTFNPTTQLITININNLSYGLNTIKTTVTNNCGNYKMIYNVTRERCKLPVVHFNSQGNATNSTYVLNASISNLDESNLITVTLNGNPQTFNFNENTGVLLSTLTLQPGNNIISVKVNKCKEIIKNLNVIFNEPCDAPTVDIISADSSASPTYVFKATITNIDDASNLEVKLNGSIVNSTYIPVMSQLKAYLTLVEGENTITVTANGCQTVTKTYKVTYNKPCVTPVITVTSDTTSTTSTYTLTVTIGGDVTQADINVVSTGGLTPTGWVDFNKNLHQYTATVNLVNGVNTITITVNGCETVTQTFVVNYKGNAHEQPGEEGPNVESNETNENTNTPSPSEENNNNNSEEGNNSNPENTNAENNQTNENTSTPNNNEENNNAGNDDDDNDSDEDDDDNDSEDGNKVDVGSNNYPIINFISPNTPTLTINSSTYLFKAKVQHINSKKDIDLYVNGIKITSFIYSTTSQQISAVLRLNKGQNTVRLIAKNKKGNSTQDYIVTYNPTTTKPNNSGTKPKTGSGSVKPNNSGTTPKTGSNGTTKPKTGSGTKTNGSKSVGGSKKTNTSGSNTNKSGGSSTIKPKSSGTKSSGTKNTGNTINKGDR